MAIDSVEEIIIPLKPLPRDERDTPREEFRDFRAKRLLVPHSLQMDEQGNFIDSWCYAACAQMVFGFYEMNVRQCEIAGFVKGSTQCCSPARPDVCTHEGCDHPDIARIYDHWELTSTPHLKPAGPISWDELKHEIDEDRPVEIVKEWTSEPDSYHAVIIIGYSDELGKVMYHDPSSDEYGILLAFVELTDSADFTWDSTWTGVKKK